jgi:hypothetical protein
LKERLQGYRKSYRVTGKVIELKEKLQGCGVTGKVTGLQEKLEGYRVPGTFRWNERTVLTTIGSMN